MSLEKLVYCDKNKIMNRTRDTVQPLEAVEEPLHDCHNLITNTMIKG